MTAWVLFGAFFLLGIYDLVLLTSEGPSATFSAYLYNLSKRYPVIAFAFGFLAGHLFWVQHGVVP